MRPPNALRSARSSKSLGAHVASTAGPWFASQNSRKMQYVAEESEEDVKRRRLASEPIDRRKTFGIS